MSESNFAKCYEQQDEDKNTHELHRSSSVSKSLSL